ncbi:MAG: hypothetical protein BWY86_00959 [Candidatus Aminicenantes bacterium ADurb.Bin508]|nr:MAG: hypothetical protein BWY86_00959 [Candidatus Aminicenantes bacterium ADurb.Bin508]
MVVEEEALPGEFEENGVPHQEGRQDKGQALVEGVVVWAHAESDPQRGRKDTPDDSLSLPGKSGLPLHPSELFEGIVHIRKGPVDLFESVPVGLGDLPREEAGKSLPLLPHSAEEVLHPFGPLPGWCPGPLPPSPFEGGDRGGQRFGRLSLPQQGVASHLHLPPLLEEKGRENPLPGSGPGDHLPVQEPPG